MNPDLINIANVVASELRAQMVPNIRLYRTGNMKRSVATIVVDDENVDVVIATDYASYTDTRGRFAGWVSGTVAKACAIICTENGVDDLSAFGLNNPQVLYGQ